MNKQKKSRNKKKQNFVNFIKKFFFLILKTKKNAQKRIQNTGNN